MVVYIRAANISPYDQEKVRRDMTEIILDGEHRGAPIKDVIGEDYRLFCDDVIAEIPKLTGRTRILSFCRDLFLLTSMLLALWLFFQCVQQMIKPSTWPYVTLTAGNLISGLLILALSTALVQAICKNAFRTDAGPKKRSIPFLSPSVLCHASVHGGQCIYHLPYRLYPSAAGSRRHCPSVYPLQNPG